MKKLISLEKISIAVFVISVIILATYAARTRVITSPPPTANTLENLQAAFNGESNANAKYLAFAKRADEEGYKKAASLFRAAARAEAIHFANHAVVIKKLGGTPEADIKTPEVGSTVENLKAVVFQVLPV